MTRFSNMDHSCVIQMAQSCRAFLAREEVQAHLAEATIHLLAIVGIDGVQDLVLEARDGRA